MDKIGKYELQEQLEKGALGAVYRAVDTQTQRIVTLRTINKDGLAERDGTDAVDHLLADVERLYDLHHPNLLAIQEQGLHDGEVYVVMDHVDGNSLTGSIDSKKGMSDKEAGVMTLELLDALHCLHDHGVVHGSLTPESIILSKAGRVKLISVARAGEKALPYRAPEVVAGQAATEKSDLYSAAALMFHLLSGKQPFNGNAGALADKIKSGPVPSVKGVKKSVSDALAAVLTKAMDKDPEARYADAGDFIKALIDAIPSLVSGEEEQQISSLDAMKQKKAEISKAVNLGQSSDLWIKVGIGVIAIFLASTGYWYFDQQSQKTEKEIAHARELAALMAKKGQARDDIRSSGSDSSVEDLMSAELGGDDDMMSLMSEEMDGDLSGSDDAAMGEMMGDAYDSESEAAFSIIADEIQSTANGVSFSLSSPADAYVYCFEQGEGTVRQIFPQACQNDGFVGQGTPQTVALETTTPGELEIGCMAFDQQPAGALPVGATLGDLTNMVTQAGLNMTYVQTRITVE